MVKRLIFKINNGFYQKNDQIFQNFQIFLFFATSFSGLQLTPEIDLGFAFSSTSSDSSAISKLMRDTIAAIIDKYGSVKLHYLALVFGNQAQTVINVTNQDQDPKTLISYINSISQPVGSPRLEVALREAKKAFDEVPMR